MVVGRERMNVCKDLVLKFVGGVVFGEKVDGCDFGEGDWKRMFELGDEESV